MRTPAPARTDPPAEVADDQTRFATLDGLRGVGALVVLLGHTAMVFHSGYGAVDFFFLHSGFVLAASNARRRRRPDFTLEFVVRRLIRLYPLYIVGAALGLAATLMLYLDGDVAWTLRRIAAASALALVLLPDFKGGAYGVFPLNSPEWSLFFELAINLVFAFTRFRVRTSLAILLVSAPLLVCSFAVWPDGGGSRASDFLGGFARIGYSFSIGALLHHLLTSGKLPRFAPPWWLCWSALPLLYLPDFGASHLYGGLLVVVIQPLLAVGFAQSTVTGRARSFALWSGMISYALYCIHVPICYIALQIADDVPWIPRVLADKLWLVGALVSIGLAHVLTFRVDVPVRAALLAGWGRLRGAKPPTDGGGLADPARAAAP